MASKRLKRIRESIQRIVTKHEPYRLSPQCEDALVAYMAELERQSSQFARRDERLRIRQGKGT